MLYCDGCGNNVLREQKDGNGKWDCLSCHKKDVHLSMFPKGKYMKDGNLYSNGRLVGRTNERSKSVYDTPISINLDSVPIQALYVDSFSMAGYTDIENYLLDYMDAARKTCNDMGTSDAQFFLEPA